MKAEKVLKRTLTALEQIQEAADMVAGDIYQRVDNESFKSFAIKLGVDWTREPEHVWAEMAQRWDNLQSIQASAVAERNQGHAVLDALGQPGTSQTLATRIDSFATRQKDLLDTSQKALDQCAQEISQAERNVAAARERAQRSEADALDYKHRAERAELEREEALLECDRLRAQVDAPRDTERWWSRSRSRRELERVRADNAKHVEQLIGVRDARDRTLKQRDEAQTKLQELQDAVTSGEAFSENSERQLNLKVVENLKGFGNPNESVPAAVARLRRCYDEAQAEVDRLKAGVKDRSVPKPVEEESKPKCSVCGCTCYYCNGRDGEEHGNGADTCVFGHASFCATRSRR